MRQDSARDLASLYGLGVVVLALMAANAASGQSTRGVLTSDEGIHSMRPIAAPMRSDPDQVMVLKQQAPIEGVSNSFFPGECVYFEDFSGFDIGHLFGNVFTGITLVTDAAHFSGLGGTPPTGNAPNGAQLDRYIAVARDTLDDRINTAFSLAFNIVSPQSIDVTAAIDSPLQVTQLMHLQSPDDQPRTNVWWSPVSFSEGTVLDRVFFGGTDLTDTLGDFSNDQGYLDRFISTGQTPGNPFSQSFFGSAEHASFDPPVNEWFTILYNNSRSANGGFGRSLWVKSVASANHSPPFLDPAMASGDVTPPDGDPVGWIMTYPGRPDDPQTAGQLEGIGFATTVFGEEAIANGLYGQSSEAPAFTVDGVQYGKGLDPPNHPNFHPDDYFFGPLCIDGGVLEPVCVIPDFTLTYMDDLESYLPGSLIRFQTSRWFDGPIDEALIATTENTTPGGEQSVAVQDLFGVEIDFQLAFGTHVPDAAPAAPSAPLTMSAQVRPGSPLNPTTHVDWGVVLQDESFSNDVAAMILLGASDPTADPIASDGMIYVRQPNPAFDPTMPVSDADVQANWINPADWTTPPSEPLNLSTILIPTGVSVAPNEFRELRVEIVPSTLDPDEQPVMRVLYGGQELFPFGDANQNWSANSRSIERVEFWVGSHAAGYFDTLHVDDVFFNGPPGFMAFGPGFTSPFEDEFSSYPQADTIDGHGFTWFLDETSVPDIPESQNDPQLTIIPSPAFDPEEGEAVCRYELSEVCLDELDVLPEAGATIAVRHTTLPPLPDGSVIDCPGALTFNFAPGVPFIVRTPDANVRIGVGRWSLLNTEPVPYDTNSDDVVGFDFLFGYEPIWRVAEPQKQGVVTTDPVEGANQVLRIINPGAIEPLPPNPSGMTPRYPSVDALLPAVVAERASVPTPAVLNEIAFDLYIESLDANGNPANLPPRSQLFFPVVSTTGETVFEVQFGGDPRFAPDIIRIMQGGIDGPNPEVSLLSGGSGITGPLINTWFRVIVLTDHNGEWTFLIDEDRDGPLAPVVLATGRPPISIDDEVDLSSLASFQLTQGRDIGGDGAGVPTPHVVQTKFGGWRAVGPPDAHPDDDYCFYSTRSLIFEHPTNPAMIADPETSLAGNIDPVFDVRPIGINQDVIAVLNRRRNADNTIAGNPLIHKTCPTLGPGISEVFTLMSSDGSERLFEARWMMLQPPPFDEPLNLNGPRPAGGISRPDGPARPEPVSYNDPTVEPPGYPATIAPRAIILAEWAMDEDNGASDALIPFPPSRWYVDNVTLRHVDGPTPCAHIAGDSSEVDGADLAQLLANWGPVTVENPADYNGDGVVNGADLATLLANWGPCP